MTEGEAIFWIKDNIGPVIRKALADSGSTVYTEDWLGAMAYRETGILIHRYQDKSPDVIATLMKGDYSQRPGETEKSYHGFGFWQIDIASYPAFVNSGDWEDPYKCCMKAIAVLEEKRTYLEGKVPASYDLHRAITAAYNCGQGNVLKVVQQGKDIDSRTHNKDYSKEVWRFRYIYRSFN